MLPIVLVRADQPFTNKLDGLLPLATLTEPMAAARHFRDDFYMSHKFDPFLGWFEADPEYPVCQQRTPNPNPAPPDDGTINHEGRAENFILDMPG
jgi:hypothetical protein